MLEIIKNPPNTENNQTKQSILQLQLDGLKEGWLIYVKTLNPLTLTIRKKETAEEELQAMGSQWQYGMNRTKSEFDT